jgi:8-oxo-dGTP diphosphatase
MKRYPYFYVTTDALLIVENEVLLVRRKHEPFQGKWALPGGFVELEEKIPDAVLRELQEETGITGVSLREFGTYGDPGRDPRGRVVCVVYWAVLSKKPGVQANDDAEDCGWFDLNHLPELAFDHARILQDACRRLPGWGKEV